MKKILVLALAGVMTMAMSIPAFALDMREVTVDTDDGTVVIPVGASYSSSEIPANDVIALDISWDGVGFNYSDQTKSTWDASKMWYTTEKINGTWSGGGDVYFTNRSNVALTATATQTSATGHTLSLSQESVDIDAASEGNAVAQTEGTPGSQTLSINGISGEPITEDVDELVVLTLTISKKAAPPAPMEKYTVTSNDRWIDEGNSTEFDNVLVNQEIEFNIGDYAEEMQGNSANYAYLDSATVTEGAAANMQLIPLTPDKGNNIKFTAAGTYVVRANFKTISGDTEYIYDGSGNAGITLTFIVT